VSFFVVVHLIVVFPSTAVPEGCGTEAALVARNFGVGKNVAGDIVAVLEFLQTLFALKVKCFGVHHNGVIPEVKIR